MASSASYRGTSAGSTSHNGDGGSSSSSYRRATDLLNHVAYVSSCATSPILSPRRRSSPHSGDRSPPSPVVSASRGHNGSNSSSGSGNSSGRSSDNSVEAHRRRNNDEVFGSSPASTHTSSSLEDLHSHHPCSANYYSFPSFDMYDDNQDKEEDIDG
ncbi:hypothetical protein SEUCBS139899_006927 [Sporothrix eucalyptigena]|uniref:Uncharacterized protein n=1 Tax=Sporothrix eucalyptigena TaxID=1812306 RepID=A0ABP0AY84_9PEZI